MRLTERGAGLHEPLGDKQQAALHMVARHGLAAPMRLMLARDGVDIEPRTIFSGTSLLVALQEGQAECLQLLIAAGAGRRTTAPRQRPTRR
eukprot:6886720-Prymnesium_polylepis.2